MRPPFYFLCPIFAWAFFLGVFGSGNAWQTAVSGADEPRISVATAGSLSTSAGRSTPASHWASQPLPTPNFGAGLAPEKLAETIDRHIDAHLVEAGLKPNDRAPRHSLLRRVSLDLTGLPPSDEVRQAFVQNDSADAYEQLVDSLLQSPAFGEHQAHYWLDLVRYADTHGLHLDNHREIWMYRDYVIDSFNQNKPMHRFITEQLAGDLLASNDLSERRQQQIASGLLRLNLTTNEAGSLYDEVFAKNLLDLTDAFGTIFLGLTTQCAACHDHKYDPMTQRDYYSLAAFFNNLDGNAMDNDEKSPSPTIAVPKSDEESQLRDWQRRIAEIDEEMKNPQAAIDAAQATWTQVVAEQISKASNDLVKMSTWSQCGPFDSETIEYAYEKSFASIGRPFDRNEAFRHRETLFHWQPFEVSLDGLWSDLPALENRQSVTVLHVSFESSVATKFKLKIAVKDGVQLFLHGNKRFDLNGSSRYLPRQDEVVLPLNSGTNDLYIKVISHQGPSTISVSVNELWAIPERIRQVIALPPDARSAEDASQLMAYYRRVWCEHPDYLAMQDEQAGAINQMEGLLKVLPTTMVYRERPALRAQHVFKGGRYDSLGEEVTRNTPAFLPPLKIESEPHLWSNGKRVANRIDLANWVTSDENPLTARAMVNRVWQQCFGRGIVLTSEDLGTMGEAPSHPELLDELASDFRSDWDLKRLIKAMVMSRAYQRDATVQEPARTIDPENRLLSRGPRYRLDAEVIRDQALALSGLLNPAMHGPSSKPPQPAGLWEAVGNSRSNTVSYFADRGAKARRRTVYTYWKRTSPPPWISLLDGPMRETCTARRERTNTPSQALMLLNEPQYHEAAVALAQMAIDRKEELGPKMSWLFEHVVGREPTVTELAELCQLFEGLQATPPSGTSADAEDEPTAEQAAWTVVASTLLNLDEVLCK